MHFKNVVRAQLNGYSTLLDPANKIQEPFPSQQSKGRGPGNEFGFSGSCINCNEGDFAGTSKP